MIREPGLGGLDLATKLLDVADAVVEEDGVLPNGIFGPGVDEAGLLEAEGFCRLHRVHDEWKWMISFPEP